MRMTKATMAKISGTRLRPGDVLEVELDRELGVLSYVGRHPHFGDLVWVVRQTFAERPLELCSALRAEGYFQFYPATTAIRHGLVSKIGFCPSDMRMIPTHWRNIINENADGTIRTWNVCDETTRVVRENLTPEESLLPIGEIINHAMLVSRVAQGWTPHRYVRVR